MPSFVPAVFPLIKPAQPTFRAAPDLTPTLAKPMLKAPLAPAAKRGKPAPRKTMGGRNTNTR
jgi:hypothetical protein